MYKVPDTYSSRSDPAQLMTLSALAVLTGVLLPVRGTLNPAAFVIRSLLSGAEIRPIFVALPLVALAGLVVSTLAIYHRSRPFGLVAAGCGLYVLWAGDQLMRAYAWSERPDAGAYLLVPGTLCLCGSGLIYVARPGVRPARITLLGTNLRSGKLSTLGLMGYIGAVIAFVEQLSALGTFCVALGLGFSLLGWLARAGGR